AALRVSHNQQLPEPSGACQPNDPDITRSSSVATTHDVYGHLSVEDARRALEAAGFLTGREVCW
ncbi:hypothetical protein ACFQ87_40740, partial [Kitasatospora sp. NPDC056531]